MAKFAAVTVQDAALDAVAASTEMYFCTGQPATRAAAIASKCHGSAIIMASGDFAKTTSSTDRVLTVAAKVVTATTAQNVDHVALCSGTTLLYVTTSAVQASNIGALIASQPFTVTTSALV